LSLVCFEMIFFIFTLFASLISCRVGFGLGAGFDVAGGFCDETMFPCPVPVKAGELVNVLEFALEVEASLCAWLEDKLLCSDELISEDAPPPELTNSCSFSLQETSISRQSAKTNAKNVLFNTSLPKKLCQSQTKSWGSVQAGK